METEKLKNMRIFYGWWIVAAKALLKTCSSVVGIIFLWFPSFNPASSKVAGPSKLADQSSPKVYSSAC